MKYRVYLRALNVEDYLKTYEWRKDPTYTKGVTSQVRFVSLETEKRWIESTIKKHEKGDEVRLAIVKKETDNLIGLISLTNINYVNRNAEIEYMIGPTKQRGQGYTIGALAQLLSYAFNELGLERVSGTILEDNKNSLRFAKLWRFEREGVLRNAVFKNGAFKNLIAVSLLNDEFFKIYEHFKTCDTIKEFLESTNYSTHLIPSLWYRTIKTFEIFDI
jgi:RimJ/RimL family protein N-acetyltransferase